MNPKETARANRALIDNFRYHLRFLPFPDGFKEYLRKVLDLFDPALDYACCWTSQKGLGLKLRKSERTVKRYTRAAKELGLFDFVPVGREEMARRFAEHGVTKRVRIDHQLNLSTFSRHWIWQPGRPEKEQEAALVEAAERILSLARNRVSQQGVTVTPCSGRDTVSQQGVTGVPLQGVTGVPQTLFELTGPPATPPAQLTKPLPKEEEEEGAAGPPQDAGREGSVPSCEDQALECRQQVESGVRRLEAIMLSLQEELGLVPSRSLKLSVLARKVYMLLLKDFRGRFPFLADGVTLDLDLVSGFLRWTVSREWEDMDANSWGYMLSEGREDSERVPCWDRFRERMWEACEAHSAFLDSKVRARLMEDQEYVARKDRMMADLFAASSPEEQAAVKADFEAFKRDYFDRHPELTA